MHQVKNIKIKGFKRLHDIDIEMKPLMVMIGENGIGKTSLLDAISLFSASAGGMLNKKLNDMGGISEILTRGESKCLTFSTEMEIEGYKPLEYYLKLEQKGQSYSISEEFLSQEQEGYDQPFKHIDSRHEDIRYYNTVTNKLVRPEWEHNPFESSLSQVPKMYRQPEELRRTLSSITQYHVLDVSQRSPVKLPQQMKPAIFPGGNGEDLIPFLYNLKESDRDRYEIIEDTLKAAFPGFLSLSYPPVASGMITMSWKEKYFKDPIYIHQLSEGILRFLWLISLLQSPDLSTVTMIDEPEVSLHPELLGLLVELLRESSRRTQIIVATHSDRLIRFLNPEEVVVMDLEENGFASVKWANSLNLDKWLEEYSLDEIWRMKLMEK